jgi:hypothetical protein
MTSTVAIEETRRLADECERLDAELGDLAISLADAEDGTQSAAMLKQSASKVETQLAGVSYLIDQYGADATVTVRGLDAGAYARVQDRAEAIRAQRDMPGDVPGARSNVFAAMGVVDAPFLTAEALDDMDPLDAKLDAVSGQPLGVSRYFEAVTKDLTTVAEGNFRTLRERLAEISTTDD